MATAENLSDEMEVDTLRGLPIGSTADGSHDQKPTSAKNVSLATVKIASRQKKPKLGPVDLPSKEYAIFSAR